MEDPADRAGKANDRVLFPWFPSHPVRPSEKQERAESLLRQVPVFRAVPPHRLRAIFEKTRRNTFAAGDTIFEAGELGATMHVISHGRVDVVRGDGKGSRVVLSSLGAGEFFGELALFDRGPRSATIVAAEETETLSLRRADILEVINRYPEMALGFLSSMSARLRSADNLLENLSRTTASGD